MSEIILYALWEKTCAISPTVLNGVTHVRESKERYAWGEWAADVMSHRWWSQPGCICVCFNCAVMSDSFDPTRLHCQWNFPGKNTRVDCHSLHHEIFSIQGLNLGLPCLLHCQAWTLYPWATWGGLTAEPVIGDREADHGVSLQGWATLDCINYIRLMTFTLLWKEWKGYQEWLNSISCKPWVNFSKLIKFYLEKQKINYFLCCMIG